MHFENYEIPSVKESRYTLIFLGVSNIGALTEVGVGGLL